MGQELVEPLIEPGVNGATIGVNSTVAVELEVMPLKLNPRVAVPELIGLVKIAVYVPSLLSTVEEIVPKLVVITPTPPEVVRFTLLLFFS